MSLAGSTPEGTATASSRRLRMPMAVKFAATMVALVALLLLVMGALGLWSSYREVQRAALQLQQEKAQAAAGEIDRFMSDLEGQLGWTARAEWQSAGIEQQRQDFTRLLGQAPAITELFYLDGQGLEQLKVSRLGPDSVASLTDHSAEPRFSEVANAKTWFGPIYSRNGSEPSMTIAMAHAGKGATVAEVSLKPIAEIVSAVRIGETGRAFVVGPAGRLVAHPDMSLVLDDTDMSGLPEVAAALAAVGAGGSASTGATGESLDGQPLLSAYAPIPRLGWIVFVQSPLAEALAPFHSLLWQSALLLAAGLVLAAVLGARLARRMAAPIGQLQAGFERLGDGDLSQRLAIRTGDEIETLADRFNDMAGRIQGSQRALQAKAEERSHDLDEALRQQAATADILKVISHSAFDLESLLETLIRTAIELCDAKRGVIWLRRGEQLFLAAQVDYPDEWVAAVRDNPLTPAADAPTTSGLAAHTGEVVNVEDVPNDPRFASLAAHKLGDYRAGLAVPLKRDGKVVGVISLSRPEALLFTRGQIALVQTFADQAVIAIENVRLFEKVEGHNRELAEALEQQTATAEVLKTISSSAFDLDSVLHTLVKSASDLCRSAMGYIYLRKGDVFQPTLQIGWSPEFHEYMSRIPVQPGRGSVAARVALTAAVVQIPDVLADPEYTNLEGQRIGGFRTVLGVPLMRDGAVTGVFILARSSVSLFNAREIELVQTFSDQAVIAIENVRLFEEVEARNRELAESLEQQTATGEILRAISRYPTDAQPVFDTIAASAARLCAAQFCFVDRFDGTLLHFMAHHGLTPEALETINRTFPMAPGRGSAAARAVSSGAVVQIPDMQADPDYEMGALADILQSRSTIAAPMLKDGVPIGVISVYRLEAGNFPDRQVELLNIFADQAVIAIENVRLFEEVQARTNDLSEALQQQTATADVLKVISRSAFDLQVVLDTLAASATRLCEADIVDFYRLADDGFRWAASFSLDPEAERDHTMITRRPGRGSASGRVLLERRTIHIPDFEVDPEFTFGDVARKRGVRSILGVPLLRENALIGLLLVLRKAPVAFTPKQIELAETFADQAVIAIENVRLFDEVQARTADLSEALQQQTATADVLKVISASAFDLDNVLAALTTSAASLCNAGTSGLYMLRDGAYHLGAAIGISPEHLAHERANPDVPGRGSWVGRTALEKAVVHVPDVASDAEHEYPEIARIGGFASILCVPLLREGAVIGVFALTRPEPGPFTERQIELVQTFADQAVIAIENARLFEEVQARTREVTEALEQQTATGAILQVIAGSPTDIQPVLDAVAESAARLCDAYDATIYLLRSDRLEVGAHQGPIPIDGAGLPVARDVVTGRAVLDRVPVHVHDLTVAGEEFATGRAMAHRLGFRAILATPLLQEGKAIGALMIRRTEARPFGASQIDLLKTFADQAVIAIENVRLFDEVQARTAEVSEALQQQTATADVLKAISRSTFDLPAVLDALVASAAALCNATYGGIFLRDGDVLRGRATISERKTDWNPDHPIKIDRRWISGRVALSGRIEHIPDVLEDREYDLQTLRLITDTRALMGVPLLREGKVEGVFFLGRPDPGAFTTRQSELVQTFADQAVIAIENSRLFGQVQARTEELSRSIEELRTAQDRLVQTEKLASLGQLTAGIAHEIKNPLNFVNSFSSLSSELVDEIRQVLESAVIDGDTRAEVEDLADTLKANLDKVVQHGKRADSIVRNMLLHSREGSGEHRLVDINSVVDESLGLAYHGARAERKDFNITLEKTLDPEAGAIDLYPQEITRVLLNLISNGFHATAKRSAETNGGTYEPMLAASTRNLGDSVEIRIRDNGTGIPADVKAKMFNPFFTTKPAGEGTGLGLSLSYDIIVKQHAGTIEVDTEPGSFTEFRIVLPRGGASLAKPGDPA